MGNKIKTYNLGKHIENSAEKFDSDAKKAGIKIHDAFFNNEEYGFEIKYPALLAILLSAVLLFLTFLLFI